MIRAFSYLPYSCNLINLKIKSELEIKNKLSDRRNKRYCRWSIDNEYNTF